jgi:type IV pilus assembly protein PilM
MANLLGKITSLDFFKKSGSVLGVDIGTSAIKIVQVKKQGGGAVLENYGALALGPYANLEVGQSTSLSSRRIIEALRDLIREIETNVKDAAIAIPLKDTMISSIEMPNVGKKQLESMVPIEARKHIPVPMSEVALNFWVMPQEESKSIPAQASTDKKNKNDNSDKDSVEVLIAAIHNDSINKYQEIEKGAGVKAKLFEIEIFSTIRSLIGNDTGPIMIIDIGAGITKIATVEYGILRGSHIINRGSQDITRALSMAFGLSIEKAEELKRDPSLLDEETKKRFVDIVSLPFGHIFSEANSVLLDYQKKHNKVINKVIFSGGGVLIPGFSDIAKNVFKTEVIVGDPFARLEAPVFLRETLKSAGPEFSVAVGLALEAI